MTGLPRKKKETETNDPSGNPNPAAAVMLDPRGNWEIDTFGTIKGSGTHTPCWRKSHNTDKIK